MPHQNAGPGLQVEDLNKLLQDQNNLPIVLDVREGWEYDLCHIKDCVHIPLSELPSKYTCLPSDKNIVVMCHHGGRSARATAFLHAKGLTQAQNLEGGIHAWALRIDPKMKTYG